MLEWIKFLAAIGVVIMVLDIIKQFINQTHRREQLGKSLDETRELISKNMADFAKQVEYHKKEVNRLTSELNKLKTLSATIAKEEAETSEKVIATAEDIVFKAQGLYQRVQCIHLLMEASDTPLSEREQELSTQLKEFLREDIVFMSQFTEEIQKALYAQREKTNERMLDMMKEIDDERERDYD